MADSSRIVLERIHHYRDTVRAYAVTIDGEKVGTVRDEKHAEFEVEPGMRRVRLRLMWITSPALTVEVPDGGETRLRCGPNGGLLQAWRLFFAPTTAIFLEPADDAGRDTGLDPDPVAGDGSPALD
jgi:hypothetical protein